MSPPPSPLVRLALAWSAVALAAFALLAATVGVPQGPEGDLIAGHLQTRIQIALLVLTALGVILARWWPVAGGAVIVLAAAAIGVFAAFELAPLAAFAPFLALMVPGVLLMAYGLSGRPLAGAVATGALVLVLVVAGVAAHRVNDHLFGPTHPGSAAFLPASPVAWVWSGAPAPDAARVTARLRDPTADAVLVVAERPGLAGRTRRIAPDVVGRDGALRSFAVTGLRPGRTYGYAVEVDGTLDRVRAGLLRTMPAGRSAFTVAIGACARRGSNGAVFDAIRREDPDLYLVVGDMFYADIEEEDVDRFRDEYDLALSRPAQQALHLQAPTAYVWDDHDYGPNDSGADSPSRDAAWASFRENVPHGPLPGGAAAGPIQQAFTIGRARFLLMDLRSARSPSGAPDGPAKSMLGRRQLRWVEAQMRQARAARQLVVLVSSVPWIGAPRAGADDWAGYADERARLSRAIARTGVAAVMLAGDAHMVALDDGTNSDYSGTGRAAMPLLHGAALDRHGEEKGGPYSDGAIAGGGQYGVMSVADDGSRLRVTLRGMDWQGRRLLGRTFVITP